MALLFLVLGRVSIHFKDVPVNIALNKVHPSTVSMIATTNNIAVLSRSNLHYLPIMISE